MIVIVDVDDNHKTTGLNSDTQRNLRLFFILICFVIIFLYLFCTIVMPPDRRKLCKADRVL